MTRNLLLGLTLVTLLLAGLVATAAAKPTHTEQSVASLGHTETIPVTWAFPAPKPVK